MRRIAALLLIACLAPSFAFGSEYAPESCREMAATPEQAAHGSGNTSHHENQENGDSTCPHTGLATCAVGGGCVAGSADIVVRVLDETLSRETSAFSSPHQLTSHQSRPEPPPPK
ncbi:MAG TPA: hypothetical protein VGC52_01840, partial [Gemmatimonadaceae bacterium]